MRHQKLLLTTCGGCTTKAEPPVPTQKDRALNTAPDCISGGRGFRVLFFTRWMANKQREAPRRSLPLLTHFSRYYFSVPFSSSLMRYNCQTLMPRITAASSAETKRFGVSDVCSRTIKCASLSFILLLFLIISILVLCSTPHSYVVCRSAVQVRDCIGTSKHG